MKGKTFHDALGIKLQLKVFKKIHSSLLLASPLSWFPALLPCPGTASSLLTVGLKSNGELGAWSPWKSPNTQETRQAHGLGTSLLWGKSAESRESLEVIAGGHGGSGGGWTEMILHLGRKGDPPSSPKSFIPTHSGTCILHGKGLFLSKHCNPAPCNYHSFKVLRSTWRKEINVHPGEQAV